MRALINAFIVHVTLNILVFLKGWHAFDEKKWARIILVVIFGTELLVYSFGLLFYRLIPDPINQFIRVMGTSWMLFLLYAGGLWLIIDMLYILRKKAQRKSWRFKDQSRQYKIITFLAPILIVAGIMTHGHYKFLHPVVQQLPVTIHKRSCTIGNNPIVQSYKK